MAKGRPTEFSEEEDKWDEAIDLTLRRFVYCTLGGAVVGFTLFRQPRTKWSAVAFGAGLGLGSAIRDSSYILGSDSAWPLDFKMAKASLITYGIVGACWLWDATSPLGWWTLKPRTKEEREMASLYQRREYPYPGDTEAVKEFAEKGGTYGTTIGSQGALKAAGDGLLSDLQREKFERESQKLWLRMQREVLQDFSDRG